MMFIGLECLQDFNVVRVTQSLQNIDLVHNFLLLRLFLHKIHVNALDGDELPSQPMQTKVDLSESALTQHFTNLVELQLSFWWLFILFKAVNDKFANQEYFL